MYSIRIANELKELKENPIENCSAGPENDDMMKWKATIFGPEDTPYHSGIFHLEIKFTEEYPLNHLLYISLHLFIIVMLIHAVEFV